MATAEEIREQIRNHFTENAFANDDDGGPKNQRLVITYEDVGDFDVTSTLDFKDFDVESTRDPTATFNNLIADAAPGHHDLSEAARAAATSGWEVLTVLPGTVRWPAQPRYDKPNYMLPGVDRRHTPKPVDMYVLDRIPGTPPPLPRGTWCTPAMRRLAKGGMEEVQTYAETGRVPARGDPDPPPRSPSIASRALATVIEAISSFGSDGAWDLDRLQNVGRDAAAQFNEKIARWTTRSPEPF